MKVRFEAVHLGGRLWVVQGFGGPDGGFCFLWTAEARPGDTFASQRRRAWGRAASLAARFGREAEEGVVDHAGR